MEMSFVYFDVEVGTLQAGRVVVELFLDLCPKTCASLQALCAEKLLVAASFTKVIRNFMVLANSTTTLDVQDNNAGVLDVPFLFAVSNSAPFSFFVTLEPAPHLNGKHTVLGRVKYGKSVVRYLERVPVETKDDNEWFPREIVRISDCGEWVQGDALPNSIASTVVIAGDIYEEWPDDNEAIEGVDFNAPESSYTVVETIKAAGTALLKAQDLRQALLKYQKAVRYCNELLPDNHNNKEWHDKFQKIKMTIFLNITLVALNSKQYQLCKDYCGYILAMDGVEMTQDQVSKVFYRMSKALTGMGKRTETLETLEKAHLILPNDAIIAKELESARRAAQEAKNEEKARYAKFFS